MLKFLNHIKPQKRTMLKSKGNKGFTLLVALMVNAIIIVIGLSVSSILFRQFSLSVLTRESQISFYAIDTLTECMRYWDKRRAFESVGGDPSFFDDGGVLYCDEYYDNLQAKNVVEPLHLTRIQNFGICEDPGDGKQYKEEIYSNINIDPLIHDEFVLKSSVGSKRPSASVIFTRNAHAGCPQGGPLSNTVERTLDGNGYNSDMADDARKIERGLSAVW